MKKLIFILATIIALYSCQQKNHGVFIISGKIDHAPGQKISLQEIPFGGDNPIVIDSGTLKPNGSFELRGMAKEEGLYLLAIENGPNVLLVNDNNNIKLQIDINSYRAYKIEGSPASESLHTLFEDYRTKDSVLNITFTTIDSLQQHNAKDSILVALRTQRDAQIKEMNETVTAFINNSSSAGAVYYALGMAARWMDEQKVNALAIASADRFKEHNGFAKLKSLLAVQKQKPAAAPKYALLGQQAPEIDLPDINGKNFQLSSLKGKYVLVDFWASWCGPCRKENPNVVAAYNKYKDKNFTILGVSLDSKKEDWEAAVKEDKLSWTHVSDLKQWESSMTSLYHFDAIPFNVLIDPQGKVIATGLRGDDLEKKLVEVLKK